MSEGTIFDIKKFAVHDGSGIRTTVFFKGCPLKCRWCHNPESREIEPEKFKIKDHDKIIGYKISTDELLKEILKDRIFYDQSGGGVTFSGGEPMLQKDFLLSLLRACKRENLNTAVDTTGFAPLEDFFEIYDWVDEFLYDIKLVDDDEHQKYTGVSNKTIIENLRKLTEKGDKIHIRIPLIPSITDTESNLELTKELLKEINRTKKISLLPYNLLGQNKIHKFNIQWRLDDLKPQSDERLSQIEELFTSNGFEVNIEK